MFSSKQVGGAPILEVVRTHPAQTENKSTPFRVQSSAKSVVASPVASRAKGGKQKARNSLELRAFIKMASPRGAVARVFFKPSSEVGELCEHNKLGTLCRVWCRSEMASVKQFPGSANWYACYKMPTGQIDTRGRPVFKRLQRSTGTTDKSRAHQMAIAYERAADLAAHKRWTEQSAHKFLAEITAVSGIEISQVEQTEKFLQRWLEAKKQTAAKKTWANFSGIISDFLKWLGNRRLSPLVDITPRLIADFRDAELGLGKSGNTVHKALAVLRQAFKEAVNQTALERNPAQEIRVQKADRKGQQRKPFTFEQFSELVRRTGPREKSKRGRKVHPDWQTFILIAGYTGGRQQEVAQLKWANVDLKDRKIGLVRTKNGDIHWMPMHSVLWTHLSNRKKPSKSVDHGACVIPHIAELSEREISKTFRETILPRIGLSQPYVKRSEDKGVGRVLASYSVHSLRHSLSTWLDSAGVNEMMRMRLIGHEDKVVSRGYTHSEHAQAAAEMEKVPSAL